MRDWGGRGGSVFPPRPAVRALRLWAPGPSTPVRALASLLLSGDRTSAWALYSVPSRVPPHSLLSLTPAMPAPWDLGFSVGPESAPRLNCHGPHSYPGEARPWEAQKVGVCLTRC